MNTPTLPRFRNALAGEARMVAGFVYDLANDCLILIRKNRPDWMAGQLNGVGGKVHAEETPLQAMVREFQEETGLATSDQDWLLFHREIRLDGPELHFFCAQLDGAAALVRSLTDEQVVVLALENWRQGYGAAGPMVYNLSFLIPMGLCYLQHPHHRYRL